MAIEERLSRLEGAYEQVDRRLDDMNQRLNDMNQRINELNQRINTVLVLLCGSWVTTMGAIIGLYVKS